MLYKDKPFPAESKRAGQSEQVPTVVAPTACEYLPAGQRSQARFASTHFAYLPAGQLVQFVAPAAAEYVPAVQLVQTVDPVIYIHTLSHTTLCMFSHLYTVDAN